MERRESKEKAAVAVAASASEAASAVAAAQEAVVGAEAREAAALAESERVAGKAREARETVWKLESAERDRVACIERLAAEAGGGERGEGGEEEDGGWEARGAVGGRGGGGGGLASGAAMEEDVDVDVGVTQRMKQGPVVSTHLGKTDATSDLCGRVACIQERRKLVVGGFFLFVFFVLVAKNGRGGRMLNSPIFGSVCVTLTLTFDLDL